tara:strand:+ start:447 stop:956 length:510 start_codon:yes stop_codon:yes gene_type:complete
MLAKFKNTFLIILLCLINVHSYAENKLPDTLYAKVIRVVDGDTIHLEHKKFGKIKVRLAEIDTPEKKQPYGQEAKKELKKIVNNKVVKLKKITIDRYGRVVGIIYYKNIEINHYLVINGYAWCYKRYNKRKKIEDAEIIARNNKVGIWKNENVKPIPPWEWRKIKRLEK